jgi:hypothetical protein
MTELEISGLWFQNNSQEGTFLDYFRTDNHIKNHFHSKLRKGIRKLNKEIKQHYKKSIKPFKLNIIYKVVEGSDYRFSDKAFLDE